MSGRNMAMAVAMVAGIAACGGGSSPSLGSVSTTSTDGGATPTSPTGGTGGTNSGAGGFVITISNLRYSPLQMSVPPGATVTVVNDDNMPHSLTSEAKSGSYTPGGVNGVSFDTGEFSSGQKTFTIPATAPAGTVIPYFCVVHRSTMATPNGTITIDPNATAQTGTSSQPTTPAPAPTTPAPRPTVMPGY